jgi:NO-binding membrane sensor protein with MHYT domain
MQTGYIPMLVAVSFVIAVMACYAAVTILDAIRESDRTTRTRLLAIGSIIFGFGVWSMHFVGMMGFMIPVQVSYDVPIVIGSGVVAVVAGYIALFFASRPNPSFLTLLLGGTLMGAGIGGMHYSGMFAMRFDGQLGFDPIMLGVSVLVAVSISTIGLLILSGKILSNFAGNKLVAGIVTGLAIPFMHYVGMMAARFQHSDNHMGSAQPIPFDNLLLVLAVAMVSIVVLISPPLMLPSLMRNTDLELEEAAS